MQILNGKQGSSKEKGQRKGKWEELFLQTKLPTQCDLLARRDRFSHITPAIVTTELLWEGLYQALGYR